MKKLTFIALVILSFELINAQEKKPIELNNGKYFYENLQVKPGTILTIVRDVPVAYQLVRSGRSRITWGYILAGLGGAVTGQAIAELIWGRNEEGTDPVAGLIGGIAMGGSGIILAGSGGKKLYEGVNLYNSSLNQSHLNKGTSLKFGLNQYGIGLSLHF